LILLCGTVKILLIFCTFDIHGLAM